MTNIFQLIIRYNQFARRLKPLSNQMIVTEENNLTIANTMEVELTATASAANQLLMDIQIYKNERHTENPRTQNNDETDANQADQHGSGE